jgi:beta-lactamase regulating signal transducer with metallopeptidase domain
VAVCTSRHLLHEAEWARLLDTAVATIGVRRPVRLLLSREHTVPFSFGLRRASIVIPAVAEAWAEDRRRAVLFHELAHVARYDCLTQTLALVACAMYWFHPRSGLSRAGCGRTRARLRRIA